MNLWNDHVIPMLGVTGEIGTGKTKFLLSIAPPDRTIIYDTEMSSADTKAYMERGLMRIDVAKEMYKLHPNGYTEKELFVWWLGHVRSLEPGRYDVICVDVANDLETGLTDWFADTQHGRFHYASAHSFRSMKGVFFGYLKAEWKKIKLDIAQRCQTFAFANHMRDEYEGDKRTGNREAKGKDTFFMLSALYLQMDFKPNDPAPVAEVLKGRLDDTAWDENGIALPISIIKKGMTIAPATPNKIREYIQNPVGARELTEQEQPRVEVLTPDQRLKLEAAKAQNEAIAAEASIEAIKEAQKLEDQRATAKHRALAAMKPQDEPADTPPISEVSDEEVRTLLAAAEAKGVKERVVKALQADLGVEATGQLTRGQVQRITRALLIKYTDGVNNVVATN
jgi:hypothetical protein